MYEGGKRRDEQDEVRRRNCESCRRVEATQREHGDDEMDFTSCIRVCEQTPNGAVKSAGLLPFSRSRRILVPAQFFVLGGRSSGFCIASSKGWLKGILNRRGLSGRMGGERKPGRCR